MNPFFIALCCTLKVRREFFGLTFQAMKCPEDLDVMGTMAASVSQRMSQHGDSKDDPGLTSGVARRLWLQVICGGKVSFKVHSSRPRIARARRQGCGKYTYQACHCKCRASQTRKSNGGSKSRHVGALVRIRLHRKCAEHLMWTYRGV